jgi:hypothetical protein
MDLHDGHVELVFSHFKIHSLQNECPHAIIEQFVIASLHISHSIDSNKDAELIFILVPDISI